MDRRFDRNSFGSYEAHEKTVERSFGYRGNSASFPSIPPTYQHPQGFAHNTSVPSFEMSGRSVETSFTNRGYIPSTSLPAIDDRYPEVVPHEYSRRRLAIEPPRMAAPINQQPRAMNQYPLNGMDHFDRASVSTVELPEDEFSNNSRRRRKTRPSSFPPDQTMSRGDDEEIPKLQKKRESQRVILTRIVSALFIVMDSVSDWMQWFDMKDPPLYVNGTSKFDNSGKNCTDIEDIAHNYMYFTIAGTAIALIQISNIIYQIRGEIVFKENQEKKNLRNLEKRKGILSYPKKFLDGRTETLYKLILIEIPQAILLLRYQNVCLPSCNTDVFHDEKHLKRRITAVINGGMAMISNIWRYITSATCCEESTLMTQTVQKKKKSSCCSCCSCCCPTECSLKGCMRCLCPCCCCFYT